MERTQNSDETQKHIHRNTELKKSMYMTSFFFMSGIHRNTKFIEHKKGSTNFVFLCLPDIEIQKASTTIPFFFRTK